MAIYERCTKEVEQIRDELMELYHGPLWDAGVTVDLLFARATTDDNGDAEGPALKLHGYRVAGICKINAYKLRVMGHGDAEITLDGDRWDEWSEDEKRALIDHELEHLELKTDRDGKLIRDDCDRPKLKMRLHDHEFGWFDSIARRHGDASFEVKQAREFIDETWTQLWLPFENTPDQSAHQAGATVSFETQGKRVVLEPGDMRKVVRNARKALAASNG